MDKTHLFIAFVAEQEDTGTLLHIYYVEDSDFGPAKQRVLSAALKDGILNPVVTNMDPIENNLDKSELHSCADEAVHRDKKRFRFEENGTLFKWPYGVIPSTDNARGIWSSEGFELQLIDGIHFIPVVVEASNLPAVYFELLDYLGEFESLYIGLHDSSPDPVVMHKTEKQTAEDLKSFLIEFEKDTLQHGYVTVGAWHDEGNTKLVCTDYKYLEIETESESICMKLMDVLERNGLELKDDLVSIHDMKHWHFADPDSPSVDELMIWLECVGFSVYEP